MARFDEVVGDEVGFGLHAQAIGRESEVEVLTQIGHTVYGFESVEDYLDECGSFVADLLIVDLNLPGESGLNLVARLRETSRNIGIIIVSARSTTYQREEGYDYGADIYLVKPLSLHELCAAVASLGRRLHPVTEESGVITVDMKSRMMTGLTKVAVQLRSSEVALLVAFSLAPEHKLQNWQMYDVVGCGLAQDPKSALELVIVHSISLPPGIYGGPQVAELFTNQLDWEAHDYFRSIRGLQVSAHFFITREEAEAYTP